jgi:hypothetical protein
VRGGGARQLGLPLPPERMPMVRGGRPLKRWRYVGVFSADLMVCLGDSRVGPLAQRWWAVALPDGSLHERTTARRGGVSVDARRASVEAPGVSIHLDLGDGAEIEVVSPAGDAYIWTRKRAGVTARGSVTIDGERHAVDAQGMVDESAGYHDRHTSWRWTTGVGRGAGGERVAWNLVSGIHDATEASERTVWVDGEPREVGPVEFADDLSAVGDLRFSEWCAREDHTNRLLFRSDYRQPFGAFSGELPGGLDLAEGYGVMEEHDVLW